MIHQFKVRLSLFHSPQYINVVDNIVDTKLMYLKINLLISTLCQMNFTMPTLLMQHIPSPPTNFQCFQHVAIDHTIPLQPLQLCHHIRTTKSQVHSFDGCLHPPITHCLNDTPCNHLLQSHHWVLYF